MNASRSSASGALARFPRESWPALPYDEWIETRRTLQRFTQIVGKIRLVSSPAFNHWWQVPLYLTPRGLTTSPMLYPNGTFAIDFDCIDHRLVITTSAGDVRTFELAGLSVAAFYERVISTLASLGINVSIHARPFDITPDIPFPEDTTHDAYARDYVRRWWEILLRTDMLFKEFNGRFLGKTSPSHLFWHSFDLALTRFSGRPAPPMPDADPVTREAYSHEVISFGWWPGDDNVRAPAFYAYTAPEPDDLISQPLEPEPARWVESRGAHLAVLMYDDIRTLESPEEAILAFLESTYQAGARTANWDLDALTR